MAYYTLLVGLTASNVLATYTHGLSITPANLVARPISRQGAVITATAPLSIGIIGTNVVSVSAGVGTTQTFDLEVQQIHSIQL